MGTMRRPWRAGGRESTSMPSGLQDPLDQLRRASCGCCAPERSLTFDAGTLKCLATAATTALLAAPSTGGAVTQTSSTPSFHDDLACAALGWTRTLITKPVSL